MNVESNYISIKQIAEVYGKSYQAISKRVNNKINRKYIIKVGGVLSIPKSQLKHLEYEK